MRHLFAYLDPGSASALVALILGGIAGVGVALKYRWNQFLVFLRIRKPIEDTPPAPEEREPEPERETAAH